MKPVIGQRVVLSRTAPRLSEIHFAFFSRTESFVHSIQIDRNNGVWNRWLRQLSEPKDTTTGRIGSICDICCDPHVGDIWCSVLWDEMGGLQPNMITGCARPAYHPFDWRDTN